MLWGIEIIPLNIPIYFSHSISMWEYSVSIPHNNVMDLNNVMKVVDYDINWCAHVQWGHVTSSRFEMVSAMEVWHQHNMFKTVYYLHSLKFELQINLWLTIQMGFTHQQHGGLRNPLPPFHNSKTNNKLTGFLVHAGAGLLNKLKYLLSINCLYSRVPSHGSSNTTKHIIENHLNIWQGTLYLVHIFVIASDVVSSNALAH
jgi:hypothetical protein